jgi:hypothetical protein
MGREPQMSASMPTTLSKIVMIPNEYKERLSMGHFDPTLESPPVDEGFQKPMIYVTDPDNRDNELWTPPQEHNVHIHTLDEDSDDASCYSCSPTEDEEDEMATEHREVSDAREMAFYRTGWQNRIVRAGDETPEGTLYYADIPFRAWGTKIVVRRGLREGPVVADVNRRGPGWPFEIGFPDHLHDNRLVLQFGCIFSCTHKFTYRGRELAWTHGLSTRRLKDLKTGEILAQFNTKYLSLHKDGNLVVLGDYAKDQEWVDVIVVTALTCQQREREIRRRAQRANGGGP